MSTTVKSTNPSPLAGLRAVAVSRRDVYDVQWGFR